MASRELHSQCFYFLLWWCWKRGGWTGSCERIGMMTRWPLNGGLYVLYFTPWFLSLSSSVLNSIPDWEKRNGSRQREILDVILVAARFNIIVIVTKDSILFKGKRDCLSGNSRERRVIGRGEKNEKGMANMNLIHFIRYKYRWNWTFVVERIGKEKIEVEKEGRKDEVQWYITVVFIRWNCNPRRRKKELWLELMMMSLLLSSLETETKEEEEEKYVSFILWFISPSFSFLRFHWSLSSSNHSR